MISCIIPVLNEARLIESSLRSLQSQALLEIIVVDGGSLDETVAIARNVVGNIPIKIIEIDSKSGRAGQLNAGAKIAQGEILLFLHIDSQLPPNIADIIPPILEKSSVILGAFSLAIDGKERRLRIIEKLVHWRSQFFSLPYGDQGLFIKKTSFETLGGFANLPIMEDYEFVQRAQKFGQVAIAPQTILTSARRWQKLGIWRTTAINQLMILGYHLRINPHKLQQWYRQIPKR